MTRPVEHLDLDDLVTLAVVLLGDPPPIRDLGLLAAAAERPRASAFGEDAYPEVVSKAAALLHSIVTTHPLVDGNKRLGWLACATFLDVNGIDPTVVSDDDVFELVMRVASARIELAVLADRLRTLLAGGAD